MQVRVAMVAAILVATAGARADDALGFVPPAPGTYKLQHIMRAPDGTVLDVDGKAKPFSRFATGKVTVLSLVYTRCSDGRGCPMASYLLKSLKARIDHERGLSERLRFVSLSFDPRNDTPEVMRGYRETYAPEKAGLPWYFLTTRSPHELEPLLAGLGQDVWVAQGSEAETGPLPHLLKVFLLDGHGSVREIYTTSFLQPQVMLNDIKTLLLEEKTRAQHAAH
ncbi:MAG TPA: SCO family protein [Myxococcales bacterium]|nr:SCO family protein [Myxococcales bacterium]